jgi:hypothetical protein
MRFMPYSLAMLRRARQSVSNVTSSNRHPLQCWGGRPFDVMALRRLRAIQWRTDSSYDIGF